MPKGVRKIPETGNLDIFDPPVVAVALVCGVCLWRYTPKLRALVVRRISRLVLRMTLPKLPSVSFFHSTSCDRSAAGLSATPKPRKHKKQKTGKSKVEVVNHDFIAQKAVRSQTQPAKEEVRTVEAKVSPANSPATSSTSLIVTGKKKNKRKKLVTSNAVQRASSTISTVVPSTLGWSPSIVSMDTTEVDISAISPVLIPARRETHVDELIETAFGMVVKMPSDHHSSSEQTTPQRSCHTSSTIDEDAPPAVASNEELHVVDKIDTHCEVKEEEISSSNQCTTALVEDRNVLVTDIPTVENTVEKELRALVSADTDVPTEVETCTLDSTTAHQWYPAMSEASRLALEKHINAVGDFDEISIKNTFLHLIHDEHVTRRRMSSAKKLTYPSMI